MNGVLIVDDDVDYRESLVQELSKGNDVVIGVSSGEDALRKVTSNPQHFRFAVIDHILKGMDGIETTRELVTLCPGLYPVVFSNFPTDSKLLEYKFKALEAGAYRYLEKKYDGPRQISEFLTEMEQLEHLRNWIAHFHEARATAPSLLTQLDVGTDIIDRHFKVWLMNDAMRRITGFAGSGLPKGPCAQWHGFTCYPCDNCLVKKSFQDGKPHSDVFLSPLVYRQDRKLSFLRVWSQLITNPADEHSRNKQLSPLAVMESVLDLTGSVELKAMSLQERLGHIAKAIGSIREREYSQNLYFEYARIYVVDRGGPEKFVLKALGGTRQLGRIDLPTNLRGVDGQRLAQAEGHMKATGYGYWFEHVDGFDPVNSGVARIPFIYWPIIQGDLTLAVMEIGGRAITVNTAEVLRPYAKEVLLALEDDYNRDTVSIATADAIRTVDEIDLALQTQPRSAEDQLKEIVRRACDLTGSHQYVVRYREGDSARLLRLSIPGLRTYEDVARSSYPLTVAESWSCRTIVAGTETVANMAEQHDTITRFRDKLDARTQHVLKDANALCYQPLILEGYCIGSMGFHARQVTSYDNKKRAVLRMLAKRAAWALQDYRMGEVIRQRTEADALVEILGVVLHNVKTPLSSIQIAFDRLLKAYDRISTTPSTEVFVNTIRKELSKIEHLQETVVRLRKPWESRIEDAQLHKLIRTVVDERSQGKDLQLQCNCDPSLDNVRIDTAAVEVCLQILLDNAVDAVTNTPVKNIHVLLRSAELSELTSYSSREMVAIDVIDTGVGVPPDIAKGLFTSMRSGKLRGTGIGLIHCRAIARSARGDTVLNNSHVPGAKFTLLLPYQRKE